MQKAQTGRGETCGQHRIEDDHLACGIIHCGEKIRFTDGRQPLIGPVQALRHGSDQLRVQILLIDQLAFQYSGLQDAFRPVCVGLQQIKAASAVA